MPQNMTVKHLIEQLESYPPEAEVISVTSMFYPHAEGEFGVVKQIIHNYSKNRVVLIHYGYGLNPKPETQMP